LGRYHAAMGVDLAAGALVVGLVAADLALFRSTYAPPLIIIQKYLAHKSFSVSSSSFVGFPLLRMQRWSHDSYSSAKPLRL